MLEVRNVTKVYASGKGSLRALDNVSINFGASGLVVVLGKSGCGKSTLLNIIGGLDFPTSGEVVINGQSTRNFKRGDYDAYRNTFVGIVFQEFNLIDDISVFDNINMTMRLQEKNADVNTVDEALAMVGLSNLGYRKPSELSGGQRQRVALARALLKKPEIVLADEPTGALDSATSEEVFETFKRIAQNKLVIVVTHNRDLAYEYADRIIEISDGKIIGDKTRGVSGEEGIKELPARVIEVGAGGRVTAEQLNSRLDGGKVNYIGLTHEKDKVALAYPETVDAFYGEQDSAAFAKTRPEQIKKDERPFKLSKGGFKMKDALTVARAGIKRSKKRYRFLTFITSLCFTFFALALVMGSVSTPSVAAKSAYISGAQPLVAVGKANMRGGAHGKLSAADMDILCELMDGVCAPSVTFTATPDFADSPYESDIYYLDADYNKLQFTGSLEIGKLSDIGLSCIDGGGKESCESINEIIISDFAAHVLCKRGFIGYDASGNFGNHYPLDVTDVLGCRIRLIETDRFYTVVGLFDTDYEAYSSIVGASALNEDATELAGQFAGNKKFLYTKIVAAEGFGKEVNGAVSDSFSQRFELLFDLGGGISAYVDSYASQMIYDKADFGVNNQMAWSLTKDGDGNYLPPDALAENEVIISYDAARNLAEEYSGMPVEEFVASAQFAAVVARPYNVEIMYQYNTVGNLSDMRIVGVCYNRSVAFSRECIGALIEETISAYDMLYFNRGFSRGALSGKFKKIHDYYKSDDEPVFIFGTASADMDVLNEFDGILGTLGSVFFIMALVMLVFAFLITFNYMSASIRFRTKEIAVYRVIGAKTFDVAKTFLVEGGFIVIITSIVATLLSFLICGFINNILGSLLYMLGVTFTLVNFNWLIEPLVIILGSAATVFLSSIIPIMRVCGKKPVEAVKMI